MSTVSNPQSPQTRFKDILPYLIFHFTGTDSFTLIFAFLLFTPTLALESISWIARYLLVRAFFLPFYALSFILDALQSANRSTSPVESLQQFQGLFTLIN